MLFVSFSIQLIMHVSQLPFLSSPATLLPKTVVSFQSAPSTKCDFRIKRHCQEIHRLEPPQRNNIHLHKRHDNQTQNLSRLRIFINKQALAFLHQFSSRKNPVDRFNFFPAGLRKYLYVALTTTSCTSKSPEMLGLRRRSEVNLKKSVSRTQRPHAGAQS